MLLAAGQQHPVRAAHCVVRSFGSTQLQHVSLCAVPLFPLWPQLQQVCLCPAPCFAAASTSRWGTATPRCSRPSRPATSGRTTSTACCTCATSRRRGPPSPSAWARRSCPCTAREGGGWGVGAAACCTRAGWPQLSGSQRQPGDVHAGCGGMGLAVGGEHALPCTAPYSTPPCSVNPDTCANKCKGKQICFENVVNLDDLKRLFKEYTGELHARLDVETCFRAAPAPRRPAPCLHRAAAPAALVLAHRLHAQQPGCAVWLCCADLGFGPAGAPSTLLRLEKHRAPAERPARLSAAVLVTRSPAFSARRQFPCSLLVCAQPLGARAVQLAPRAQARHEPTLL